MSKTPIPLTAPDISQFARHMKQQLLGQEAPPSHLSLMNRFARAVGFRNYQHMKAAHTSQARLDSETPQPNTDFRLVERTLHQFDEAGSLIRWPSRRPVQELCLWSLWSDIPSATSLHEKQVNVLLSEAHLFADPALLRRSLYGLGLVSRNRDGSDYRRLEKSPPSEAKEVIRRVRSRRKSSVTPGQHH